MSSPSERTLPANAAQNYEVTAADLPLSCPMPQMALWNSAPARLSAHREDGVGQVSLLRGGVQSQALSSGFTTRLFALSSAVLRSRAIVWKRRKEGEEGGDFFF